jgi:hypothetical protein
MRGLTSTEALWIWERGRQVTPGRRVLEALAVVDGGETVQSLARLTVGERDARLLELHERTFGEQLPILAKCPACAQELQAELESDDVRIRANKSGLLGQFSRNGFSARLRTLDGVDFEAATAADTVEGARAELMRRALLDCRGADGSEIAVEDLPEEFIAAAAAKLSAADPQADVELALACPHCDHTWNAVFDIAEFFWTELQCYARRILREVHELAAAYGWSEGEILALTPARRAGYLELVRG